jgi:hypothetical protein
VRAYVYYIVYKYEKEKCLYQCRTDQSRDPELLHIRRSFGGGVHNAKYFFAWKDGILIGTYNTLGQATASLASGKGPKTTTVRQSA